VSTEKFNDNTTLAVITDKEPSTVIDKVVSTLQEVTQVSEKQLHPLDNSEDQGMKPRSPQLRKRERQTNKRIIEMNPTLNKDTMLGKKNNLHKKHQGDGIRKTRKRNIEHSITPMKGCIEGVTTPKKKIQKVLDDPRANRIKISPGLRKMLVSVSSVKDSDSTSQHSVRDHEDKDYIPSESSDPLSSDEQDTISSNDESSDIKNCLAVCHDDVDDETTQNDSSDAEDEDYTPSVSTDDDLHLVSEMERTDEDVSHDASYQADLKQYHKEAFYRAYAPYYKGASNSTKLITREKYDRIKDIIRKPKIKNESAVVLKYR
jgi:cobalamin biosynthesis protein CobT